MRIRRSKFAWPDGARGALSLTFDDAEPSQISDGLPLLERLGVAATFFVLPGIVATKRRAWLDVVERGHEIGNHTVSHPCGATNSWRSGHALHTMTLDDMRRELASADAQICDLLGVEPSVFAYPCGQTAVGQGANTSSYVPLVAELFMVGRTFNDRWANSPAECDLAQIGCVSSDGVAFAQLEPYLESARANAGWLVLGGHEIGEAASLVKTAAETIEAVVNWSREQRLWIDTLGSIGSYVAAARI